MSRARLANLGTQMKAEAAGSGTGVPAVAFPAMPPHGDYASYTGPDGYTNPGGRVRICNMLKCRADPELMEGYKEHHRKVLVELQEQIRLSGTQNYSIFMRGDGLLFLYHELDEDQAALGLGGEAGSEVGAKWAEMMAPYLEEDYEFNGPLKHVMFMGPNERSMDEKPAPIRPIATAPSPPYGEYSSFTGGGGTTKKGWIRRGVQLKCRSHPELLNDYNKWHCKVWPELQQLGFHAGQHNYSIFQRADGLLFLYSEHDPAQAAASKAAGYVPDNSVNTSWQSMMDKYLERNYEYNGPLEHVMYIGEDRVI